jgi:rubrerythrin
MVINMLPKISRINNHFEKNTQQIVRVRSSSGRGDRVENRGYRNASPKLALIKNQNLQKVFERVNKDEETHFVKLLHELY